MFFNPLYLVFALPGLLLAMLAQWSVRSTFKKYAKIPTQRQVNGIQTAQILMHNNGLLGISVQGTQGQLTDFYNPANKSINLSDSSSQNSIASVSVVAHELGHAQQDADNYLPLKLRGAIVPAVQVGAWVGPVLFFVGLLIGISQVAWLGVAAFGLTTIFSLVTLPVELDASNRAMHMLQTSGILAGDELTGARQMLNAAAFTYVAAAMQSILTMLYYVTMLGGLGGRRRS
jgi:Zn-dependent membrane protease YugP